MAAALRVRASNPHFLLYQRVAQLAPPILAVFEGELSAPSSIGPGYPIDAVLNVYHVRSVEHGQCPS